MQSTTERWLIARSRDPTLYHFMEITKPRIEESLAQPLPNLLSIPQKFAAHLPQRLYTNCGDSAKRDVANLRWRTVDSALNLDGLQHTRRTFIRIARNKRDFNGIICTICTGSLDFAHFCTQTALPIVRQLSNISMKLSRNVVTSSNQIPILTPKLKADLWRSIYRHIYLRRITLYETFFERSTFPFEFRRLT